MKKEKSPILVILTIFFLSLFIILPPVFRKTMPKKVEPEKVSKMTIVICNKSYMDELYRVNSKSKYNSNGTITNAITYTKIDPSQITENNGQDVNQNSEQNTDQNTEQVQENNSSGTIEKEIMYFKSIPNLNVIDAENATTVTIDQDAIEANPTEEKLISYLNDAPKSQKKFYENLGYICTIIES